MSRTCSLLRTAAILLLSWTTQSHALPTAPPPAEAFGTLPTTLDVSISPDGNTLAWYDHSGAESLIVMFDVRTRKYVRYLKIDPVAKFRAITWLDNDTALITVSFTRDLGAHHANWSGRDVRQWEMFRTIAADKTSTPGRILLMTDEGREPVAGAELISRCTSKPRTVLMATLDIDWRWESRIPPAYSLFEVDTVTGKGHLLYRGTPTTQRWIADPTGERIARSEWNRNTHVFDIQVLTGSDWHSIYRHELDEPLAVEGFSADGTAIIAMGVLGEGRAKLWTISLDASQPKALLEDPENDVESVSLDPYTGAPRIAWFGGVSPKVNWLDRVIQTRTQTLAASFPGRRVDGYASSSSGDRAVFEVSLPSGPATYYLIDFNTHKADIVGEEYPMLASVPLGEVRVIHYKARDGMEIPTYLTLPPGVAPQHLPLVVLPHGGPESHDLPDFNWWTQFLATRGYAVLQPQFRGSTGFGQAFREAGYQQWAGRMQDDVSDGVSALISQGIADPKRVCIVGASYGGFAALAGAAFTPTLYACAVSINGVSDLPEMLAYLEHRHSSGAIAYWRKHVGAPFDPALKDKSPLHAAEHITAPVLLMHASNDTVVPFTQSEAMAHALESMHKPVTLVTLPAEDHWLSRSDTRTQMLRELEKFLAAHL